MTRRGSSRTRALLGRPTSRGAISCPHGKGQSAGPFASKRRTQPRLGNSHDAHALLSRGCARPDLGCSLPRITVLEDPLSPEEHLSSAWLTKARRSMTSPPPSIQRPRGASCSVPVPRERPLSPGQVCGSSSVTGGPSRSYRGPRPYNNLAWLYYTQGINLDEAENLARRAVALAPAGGDAPYRDTLDQILKARSQGGKSSQSQ